MGNRFCKNTRLNARRWSARAGFCAGVWLFCHAITVSAVEVSDLYSAEVPVETQSPQERAQAIREALAAVLVKVTGNKFAADNPNFTDVFKQANRYIEQFRYREIDVLSVEGGDEEPPSPQDPFQTDTESVTQTVLWVRFDPPAINRVVANAQMPLWSSTRPLVLVWVAVQEGGSRYLLEPELQADALSSVRASADRRGVPVVFPLMDLEDQMNISVSDVWGNFTDAITRASDRYRADAILVGRVHRVARDDWRGRWTLYQGEEVSHWEAFGNTLLTALATGVDINSDTLAGQFAQVWSGDGQERLSLSVADVVHFDQYAKALKYLESLDQVASVRVSHVERTRLEFELQVRGSRNGLRKVIRLGNVLSEVETSVVDPDPFDFSMGLDAPIMEPVTTHAPDLSYRLK